MLFKTKYKLWLWFWFIANMIAGFANLVHVGFPNTFTTGQIIYYVCGVFNFSLAAIFFGLLIEKDDHV